MLKLLESGLQDKLVSSRMNIKSKMLNVKGQQGFTLIELMVSISIFSVVIIIAVGALLNLTRAADRSAAVLTAINNLDFAMEQMSRTLRVGTHYYCSDGIHPLDKQTRDCAFGEGRKAISFTDNKENRLLYKFDPALGSLNRENLSSVPSRIFSITAPEIIIESLTFNVFGSDNRDSLQPRVLMRIKGRTALPSIKLADQVTFNLETMITQRNPDL